MDTMFLQFHSLKLELYDNFYYTLFHWGEFFRVYDVLYESIDRIEGGNFLIYINVKLLAKCSCVATMYTSIFLPQI
jgi:hypothetical protein